MNIRKENALRSQFNTLQEIYERHTPNDEYEIFITTHMEATADFIPSKPKTNDEITLKSMLT